MPNWCENALVVTGTPESVSAFVDAVRSAPGAKTQSALSLERIHPTPAELLGADARDPQQAERLVAKYGYRDWFSYRVAHHGTKWEVEARLVDRLDVGGTHAACYEFASAWSPPTQALLSASLQHPEVTLRLSWAEPGCGEAAYCVMAAGEMVEEFGIDVPVLVTELVVDTCGVPLARRDAYTPSAEQRPVPKTSVAEAVVALLRADASCGPDPRVLVTCWEQPHLPQTVLEDLFRHSDLHVTVGGGTALAQLTHAALSDTLIGDGLAQAWYEALWESWESCAVWLPRTLAHRSAALTAAAPLQTLAVQVAVCFDVAPEVATAAAAEVLAAGVEAAPAIRLIGEMYPDLPALTELTTVVAGALLTPTDLDVSRPAAGEAAADVTEEPSAKVTGR